MPTHGTAATTRSVDSSGDPPALPAVPLPAVSLRARHDGWTAARQAAFLGALAETGSVTQAAADCGLSARSAYRLRARSEAAAFALGWDEALRVATGRLTALAFERAVTGRTRQLWKNGELVATTREPSDRLLMFLLDTLYHRGYSGSRAEQRERHSSRARERLPDLLGLLDDSDCPAEFITQEDIAGAVLVPPAAAAAPMTRTTTDVNRAGARPLRPSGSRIPKKRGRRRPRFPVPIRPARARRGIRSG